MKLRPFDKTIWLAIVAITAWDMASAYHNRITFMLWETNVVPRALYEHHGICAPLWLRAGTVAAGLAMLALRHRFKRELTYTVFGMHLALCLFLLQLRY